LGGDTRRIEREFLFARAYFISALLRQLQTADTTDSIGQAALRVGPQGLPKNRAYARFFGGQAQMPALQ
jgi:hypothetical protein